MNDSAFFLRRMNDHVQYLGKIKATLEDKGVFQGTDHHSCKLGLWLESDGPEQSSAISAEAHDIFNQLLTPHERFHQASKQALDYKATGDIAGMEYAMTEMFKLSNALVTILIELDSMNR
ncbi:MAG: CZB domain-containing protein [Candidatus Thiodiazotropha sp. 6PLUC2]